ncbi:MAG: hypothetical protein JRF50_15985 [Deltaproteobacteria bacterium]|nr:hypothetical protein [Deltaproteobacteria bacterium]
MRRRHKSDMERLFEAGLYGWTRRNTDDQLRAIRGIVYALLIMLPAWIIALLLIFRD